MPISLLWLALGSFSTGTALFVVAGLLPTISADLQVSLPMTGHLVTAFAITYAIAAPIIAAMTGALERRRLLVFAMLGFAAANVLAALAPSYVTLLLARVAIALAAAAYVPAATGYALATTAPEKRGRAISMVIGGMTIATVVGAPLGALLGETMGWRAPFWVVAGLSVFGALGIGTQLKALPGVSGASVAERLSVLRQPGVGMVLVQGAMLMAGAFAIYTYLSPFLTAMLGFDSHGVQLAIMVFGLGGVIGNPLGGWMADRWSPRKTMAVVLFLVGILTALFSVLPPLLPATLATPVMLSLICLWGIIGWSYSAPQQSRLVRIAPAMAPVLLSFHASSTYLGTSLGALVGSGVMAAGQLPLLGWAGAALEFAGLLLLLTRREPAMVMAAAE